MRINTKVSLSMINDHHLAIAGETLREHDSALFYCFNFLADRCFNINAFAKDFGGKLGMFGFTKTTRYLALEPATRVCPSSPQAQCRQESLAPCQRPGGTSHPSSFGDATRLALTPLGLERDSPSPAEDLPAAAFSFLPSLRIESWTSARIRLCWLEFFLPARQLSFDIFLVGGLVAQFLNQLSIERKLSLPNNACAAVQLPAGLHRQE